MREAKSKLSFSKKIKQRNADNFLDSNVHLFTWEAGINEKNKKEEEEEVDEQTAIALREVKQKENLKNAQKWSTSHGKKEKTARKWREKKCNRHKSKQMFCSSLNELRKFLLMG